ncbi:hypothetical protein MBLNU457_g0973t1 [Dothideomycetes sp. NU457]
MSDRTREGDIDLGLKLSGTHVLITGGAGLIGRVIVSHFLSAGAQVSSLDISYGQPGPGLQSANLLELQADVSDPASFTAAWKRATHRFGTVQTCIALASLDLSVLPQTDSIADYDPEIWKRVLDINVGGTFMAAKLWLAGLRDHQSNQKQSDVPNDRLNNVSFVIMGSEAGHFGVRTCAPYAAAKSAVQGGLLHSLRADAPRIYPRARVNAIAPGPVDTSRFREETGGEGTREWWAECVGTTALREPVPCEAVARTALVLASEAWSGSVTGQCVNVDSGKMGAVMWHPDERKG